MTGTPFAILQRRTAFSTIFKHLVGLVLLGPEIVDFFNRKLGPGDNTPDKRAQPKLSLGSRDSTAAGVAEVMRGLRWCRIW